MKALWLCFLALSVAVPATQATDTDYTELCRLFTPGTTLRMPGSCQQYIECNENESKVHSCVSPKSFDVKSQYCVETLDSTSLCGNRCEGINGKWVSDPTNCHGFFYCVNGVAHQGYCQNPLHFDEKSQMCVYTTSSSCVDVANICEIVADKTKFRDESDCSKYYECSKNVQSHKDCTKNTYFNIKTQTCVEKSQVACNAHPIPSGICTVNKSPYVGFRSDQATCRGYFYCSYKGDFVADIEPMWGQCPEGKFFNQDTQGCVNPPDVKCDYNRCEGRGNSLVVSGNNNCHNYLVCVDGYPSAEKTCDRDFFFNENLHACTAEIIYDKACDIPVVKT